MLKNDEVDYCTKCTVKPIVKEHMCEKCYTEHNEWLRDLVSGTTTVKDGIIIDADGYYTIYESGERG
ncbi:hypothetical protein [Jeotgalicoccus halotolerans]|uniref:hypothetical protein n=1 Tax=Jeotgalicoccus halotolerans TaxID=157227 RepID=UPI000E26BF26